MQPKEICHYETACNDTQTGGFRDKHSGCRTPYQKQVCEENPLLNFKSYFL